ncbi:MAG TPA: methyltransferase domain-containing protein [Acidimicrobiales bacterium]|nr:methyltransferase domain-containing protein [Acidimicrobiales bacterium]
MEHPRIDPGVRRERLVARARGRTLELGEPRDWLTNSDLPLHAYDTVVSVLELCRVDDVYSALLRVKELLAPDGQFLALEHVRATGWRGRVQDAASPLWRRVARQCHPDRDIVDILRKNGFAITDCDRFALDGAPPLLRQAVSVVAIRKVRNEVAS